MSFSTRKMEVQLTLRLIQYYPQQAESCWTTLSIPFFTMYKSVQDKKTFHVFPLSNKCNGHRKSKTQQIVPILFISFDIQDGHFISFDIQNGHRKGKTQQIVPILFTSFDIPFDVTQTEDWFCTPRLLTAISQSPQ